MKKQLRKTKLYYAIDPEEGNHLYWCVPTEDAKQEVIINGTLADAMRGKPGMTIGCHLSNCAMRNAKEFPHPVKLVAFTRRSCFVVTKIANGAPAHCVRYKHTYSDLCDLNDKKVDKNDVLREHPEIVEREFMLLVPRKKDRVKITGPHDTTRDIAQLPKVPSGALRRARDAGLITVELPY